MFRTLVSLVALGSVLACPDHSPEAALRKRADENADEHPVGATWTFANQAAWAVGQYYRPRKTRFHLTITQPILFALAAQCSPPSISVALFPKCTYRASSIALLLSARSRTGGTDLRIHSMAQAARHLSLRMGLPTIYLDS